MNATVKFIEALRTFLDRETEDYSLAYEIVPMDESGVIEVVTWRFGNNRLDVFDHTVNSTYWQWDDEHNMLLIEMGVDSDSWYPTCDYDWSVKYFWMMVSPHLFGDK